MSVYTNKSIVLCFIQKAAEHPNWKMGKKSLQKSLYFFNLGTDCFSFRWASFGPMSGEIQQIVHDLEMLGRIKIQPVETGKPGAILKQIEFVSKDLSLNVSQQLDAKLDDTMKFVADRDSRDLELLASVHFWAQRNGNANVAEYVYDMLNELKPDAKFTREDVQDALQSLAECGFLS